ncbi:MAG: NAD(P)-binding protein, partial [Alphaproteobacteria bacterium]
MALPIAILGAGLGGISAARALIARGHAVTIFDK